jgi:hypothetical protein
LLSPEKNPGLPTFFNATVLFQRPLMSRITNVAVPGGWFKTRYLNHAPSLLIAARSGDGQLLMAVLSTGGLLMEEEGCAIGRDGACAKTFVMQQAKRKKREKHFINNCIFWSKEYKAGSSFGVL